MNDISIPVSRENFFAILNKHMHTIISTYTNYKAYVCHNGVIIGVQDNDNYFLTFPNPE